MPERKLIITPESLMDDNNSQLAQDRLTTWQSAKEQSDLIAVWACSDSRLVLPYQNAIHIYSITAGGPRSPYDSLLEDKRIKADVIVCHHDGDEVAPGVCPGGCGGRAAKEVVKNGSNKHDVIDFIDRDVWNNDLVKQSLTAGAFTAYRTGRPTLSLSQDNLDLMMYPLASYSDGGKDAHTEIPQHLLLAGQYFPESIYRNGLPVLSESKIPKIFDGFLEENLEQVKSLARRYDNLKQMQKSQNPSLLVVSTDIRPMRVRYPHTTEVPGSVFRISVPQLSIDGVTPVSRELLYKAFEQVDYPVEHFSNLSTILIESRDAQKSQDVAYALANQEWMKPWLQEKTDEVSHKILTAQVIRGRTLRVSELALDKSL